MEGFVAARDQAVRSKDQQAAADGDAKSFTAVGMLAATNDAFYAVRGVPLPKRGRITVRAK